MALYPEGSAHLDESPSGALTGLQSGCDRNVRQRHAQHLRAAQSGGRRLAGYGLQRCRIQLGLGAGGECLPRAEVLFSVPGLV